MEKLTKEQKSRIAELERQILEIKKDVKVSYQLIKVVPDCGGGIKDSETIIAVCEDLDRLVKFCIEKYKYEPSLGRERNDNLQPCDTWYKIDYSTILILHSKS